MGAVLQLRSTFPYSLYTKSELYYRSSSRFTMNYPHETHASPLVPVLRVGAGCSCEYAYARGYRLIEKSRVRSQESSSSSSNNRYSRSILHPWRRISCQAWRAIEVSIWHDITSYLMAISKMEQGQGRERRLSSRRVVSSRAVENVNFMLQTCDFDQWSGRFVRGREAWHRWWIGFWEEGMLMFIRKSRRVFHVFWV